MKRALLVDACNILNRIPLLKGLMDSGLDLAAGQLLQLLQPLHDLEGWEVHVVVDGKGRQLEQQFSAGSRTLSLVFAPRDRTADAVIESWLLRFDTSWELRIASEDRAIRHTALARGAEPLSARQLLDWLDRVQQRFRLPRHPSSPPSENSFEKRLDGLL